MRKLAATIVALPMAFASASTSAQETTRTTIDLRWKHMPRTSDTLSYQAAKVPEATLYYAVFPSRNRVIRLQWDARPSGWPQPCPRAIGSVRCTMIPRRSRYPSDVSRSQLRHGRGPGQAPPVSPQASSTVKPLSDDEFDQLADFLESRSPFDTDGLLGVLNAVAVAPSLLPPSAWLPVVLPTGLGDLDATEAEEFFSLLFRLHADVIDALEHQQAVMPGPEEVAECKSFAAGYAAGAEIDPEWIGNDDRWTFASSMAYLGGRLDLVPQKTCEDIQLNFAPDPEQILCQSMGALIRATSESFKDERKRSLSGPAPAKTPGSSRVGRNDPCPCGSGKKYKRCCINAAAHVDAE